MSSGRRCGTHKTRHEPARPDSHFSRPLRTKTTILPGVSRNVETLGYCRDVPPGHCVLSVPELPLSPGRTPEERPKFRTLSPWVSQ